MNKARVKTAVGYIRLVGLMTDESLLRQRAAIQRFADLQKLTIANIYKDAVPRMKLEWKGRRGLAYLVNCSRESSTRIVIVADREDLSRSIPHREALLQFLSEKGLRVVEAATGADLGSADCGPESAVCRAALRAMDEVRRSALCREDRLERERWLTQQYELKRLRGQENYEDRSLQRVPASYRV